MADKLLINVTSGESGMVPLTPEEEADRQARAAEHDAVQERRARYDALLAELKPGPELMQRVRDGTAPSTGDLVPLVRYLLLRDAGGP